jgi:FAD dependent oxidoreductase TIGR03364
MDIQKTDIAIVGAGIVGLAHALAAARRGLRVTLFEREERAVGASIRNFGLPWPVGLALTPLYQRALRSRAIWLESARQAGFGMKENGSLFLAYRAEEEAVLREFFETFHQPSCSWLRPDLVAAASPAARLEGLRAGLFSSTELTVDPRQAIRLLPDWLAREHGIEILFQTPVSAIHAPYIETARGTWQAEHIFVCSGPDLEALYPQIYRESGFKKCKLQMLRLSSLAADWQLGPTLASGLTIARYDNFSGCASTPALRSLLERELPEQTRWGIHVLLAQNGLGELLVGDTHQDGLSFDPFESERANALILAYLETFTNLAGLQVLERWHGIYPKLDGRSEFVFSPEDGVTLVQITNGLGMTLSFGLAEENLQAL